MGYSPQGHKKSDMTKVTEQTCTCDSAIHMWQRELAALILPEETQFLQGPISPKSRGNDQAQYFFYLWTSEINC